MGAPNIQQQLYLKTALNESKDGMFEHPTDLGEGYYKKSRRLIRAGDFDRAAEQGDRAEASSLMRGGASKRTMKAHFNQQDNAAGTNAQRRFDKAAAKKRDAALKAKGIAEALEEKLDEGYQAKRKRIIRKYGSKQLGSGSLLSPKLDDFMRRSFKKKRQREERISGGKGSAKAMEISARKKTAAMKAKGLTEGSLGQARIARVKKSIDKTEVKRTKAWQEHDNPGFQAGVRARIAGAQQLRKLELRKIARERMGAGLDPRIPKTQRKIIYGTRYGQRVTTKTTPARVVKWREASAAKAAAGKAKKD